jgi:Flp pilus assembly pilin Flp
VFRPLRVLWAFWRESQDLPAPPSEPPALLDSQEVSRRRERGQSLIEYTILLAWLTLASIGFIRGVGSATKGIWVTTNATLTNAATTAGS